MKKVDVEEQTSRYICQSFWWEKAVTVDISTKEEEEEKPLAMGVAGMNFMVLPHSGDSDD